MPSVREALVGQKSQLEASLDEGLDVISYDQEITFTRYVRCVLPLDGFVFWIKADLVSHEAMPNNVAPNEAAPNQTVEMNFSIRTGGIGEFAIGETPIGGYGLYGPIPVVPATTLTVKGSLHYSIDTRQEESETYGVNRVVFSAEEPVQELNAIGPDELYIGTFQDIRFAFSSRGMFYDQAGIQHYAGDAIYSDMESQIIDRPQQFDAHSVVVSNSLPIWLKMNLRPPVLWEPLRNPIRLYPSFLLPTNLRPPYGAVHIAPESTEAIAQAPIFSSNLSRAQLATDVVKVTLYGLRNHSAQDFADFVSMVSYNDDEVGMMSVPIVRDEKRIQSELGAIGMMKTIEFQVSYLQSSARQAARQVIQTVVPSYVPREYSPRNFATVDVNVAA